MHFDPWTFGLQAANFLVLAWLLHRFLYKPVLKVIAARQASTDTLTTELKAEKSAVEAQKASLESRQAALAAERDALLAKAREAAAAERKALLAKARTDADAIEAKTRKGLERERDEIVRSAGRDATRLATSMVRSLLVESDVPIVQDRMLQLVCDDIRALPADTRKRMTERAADHDTPPEVVTATALDAKAAKRFSDNLSKALGAPAEPTYRVDPALIAGVEIHFPFTTLKRSWAEHLQRISAELNDDDGATTVA